MTDRENTFAAIYDAGGWGGKGSGGGSDPLGAKPYVDFVLDYVVRHDIRSVVDVGCGDWRMWPTNAFADGTDYLGLDIAESVVEVNERNLGISTRRFAHLDAIASDPPAADLLLCKEVLQHLPNADIHHFLHSNLKRYPHVILCTDVRMESSVTWRRWIRRAIRGLGSPVPRVNNDIAAGGYRPVRFDRSPLRYAELRLAGTYIHVIGGTCRTEKAIWVTDRSPNAGTG